MPDTIILKSIVEEGCGRERSNERCIRAAAGASACAPPTARECAWVSVHFARGSQEMQGRLAKAIFESVLLAGSSVSPL